MSTTDGRRAELLAPAGSMTALEAVLAAGADAVYVGGKRFGMRGHRSSFHFDDYSIRHAVQSAHRAGARLYVTVNNLLFDDEVEQALGYIVFLREIGVDAVILQDLGLLRRLAEDPPGLDIHASTMMNVHSSPFAAFLKSLGVSRIITSRDISLSQVARMARRTGLEMEYFVHGDMCSVQSGLCLLSGILFGQSANRGRCLKPCRWPWKITAGDGEKRTKSDAFRYHLARKDMCLLHVLPEVLESGIVSLKIEGRMRPADYLEKIVGVYRRALDRYYADPFLYEEAAADAAILHQERTRDFTSCHAFGRPGPDSIDPSGAREPKFFSTPVPPPALDLAIAPVDPLPKPLPDRPPKVCVALNDVEQVDAVLAARPDWIYLVPHFKSPRKSFSLDTLSGAVMRCRDEGVKSAIVLPPVTPDHEIDRLIDFVNAVIPGPDAWMAGNAGQLGLLKEAREGSSFLVMADGFINAFNRETLALLAAEGVTRCSLSHEITLRRLASMALPFPVEIEITVHGLQQAMFLEDCLLRLALDKQFEVGSCRHLCDLKTYALENEAGERFPLITTKRCRNALFFSRQLCLLHRLGALLKARIFSLRLNLFGYGPEAGAKVVTVYQDTLNRIFANDPDWLDRRDLVAMEKLSKGGLWEAST